MKINHIETTEDSEVAVKEFSIPVAVAKLFIIALGVLSTCYMAIAMFQDTTLQALEKNYASAVNNYIKQRDLAVLAIQAERTGADLACNTYRALKAYKESIGKELTNGGNPCVEFKAPQEGPDIVAAKPEGGLRIFFTSYNPVPGQTDASPCVGASGINQCDRPDKIIALSQDLVGREGSGKMFKYGDIVRVVGETDDPRCNGEMVVMDTMAARYTNRGDLFFMDKKDNMSCYATISKAG